MGENAVVENAIVDVQPASWETVGVRQVKQAMAKAEQEGKYLFVWDKQGQVGTFFRYAGSIIEFDEEVERVEAGRQTASMALQALRTKVLHCSC